jgi:hypothetical protein
MRRKTSVRRTTGTAPDEMANRGKLVDVANDQKGGLVGSWRQQSASPPLRNRSRLTPQTHGSKLCLIGPDQPRRT